MKRIPLIALILVLVPQAQAADLKDVTYSIEPIIGYELQRKSNPTRDKLVLSYGARAVAGYKILSAEGEYTQGKSDEYFSTTSTRIEEKSEKIRLGLRSTYAIASLLDWFFRAGAEAQKRHTTETVGSAVTESDSPYKVYPYVGTGASVTLGSKLSLNVGVLATLKDINDLKQTEYSTTFGLNINFNSK